MPRYTVPQFIEHEAKIIGGFMTFRQFMMLAFAGATCFVLWFILPFTLFFKLMTIFFIIGLTGAFAFLKVSGVSLAGFLWGAVMYKISPKIYVWGRKDTPAAKVFKGELKIEESREENGLPLKVGGSSRLKSVNKQIETGSQ